MCYNQHVGIFRPLGTSGRWTAFGLTLLLLSGCSIFRPNPLEQNRGALVLVFDTRTAGDPRALGQTLSDYDARATIFVSGQIRREIALTIMDLQFEGHEVGLSGLKGMDPQSYSLMYGQQKYFQDEIVTQVLGARRNGLDLRYFLLQTLSRGRSLPTSLPSFIASKGFDRVVHRLPATFPPRAKPASDLRAQMVQVYRMTEANFDRGQIAKLAEQNRILVVEPSRQVLPNLLREARLQGVPFATLADLPRETE